MSHRKLLVTSLLVVGLCLAGVGVTLADTPEQEPNDDFSDAQPIEEGNVTGEIVDGESDFFAIDAQDVDALDLELVQRNADINLVLYGPDRNQIGRDSFRNRAFTRKAPRDGTYYIEVVGDRSGTNGQYTLNVDRVTPAENDAFAPNDDFQSAAPIEEGLKEGKIWGGESDFFAIDAQEVDALDLELVERNGEINLVLYGPDRNQIGRDSFRNRAFTRKAPRDGTYYIEVVGEQAGTTGNYTLRVDRVTPAENDAFAPNDDFQSAAPLEEGFSEGKIWGGESDFFRIDANDTDALDLELTERNGAINLRLYGPDRNQLAGDTFRNRDITLKAPETGTYYVEVAGERSGTTGNYTLSTDKVTPAENDDFAPNDDFQSAAPLEEGFTEGRIWGGESDFFRIDANDTDALDLELTERNGEINLVLYGPDRDQLIRDSFRNRDITLKAPETGTYYVEIVGEDQETTGDYTLNADKVTPSENDDFAPNDDFATAVNITQQFTEATIWGGESDFFRVGLDAGEAIDVSITSGNGVNLALYAPDGSRVARDTFRQRQITREAQQSGTYYVEVEADQRETTTDYTLSSNKTGAPPRSLSVSLSPSSVSTNETVDVTVTVNNSDLGAGVTGATVSAPGLGVTTTTDGDGTAVLTVNVSQSGDYTVTASADGYADATATLSASAVRAPTFPGASNPATDTDGDGILEDANGDGQFTPADVTILFNNRNSAAVQDNPTLFDFNEDGSFTPADVTTMFNQVL